jgi:hypothetical protein
MPSDVAEFEQRHNVRLPSDLREYFLTLNGGILGHEGSADNDLISFWRLDQVESIVDSHECASPGHTDVRHTVRGLR